MKRNYPVGALILEASKENAETFVNGLRRTGLSLRPGWVNRPGMFAEYLRRQPWDLLLAGFDTPVIQPAEMIEVIRRSGCDLALIGVVNIPGNEKIIEDALRAGFHDVVPLVPSTLFEHAVVRELESLEQRRRVRRLRSRLQASTGTLRELIHKSDLALAFLHRGQILQANPAWMFLMGIPAGEDPSGRPFSDYVAEVDREEFSLLLDDQAQTPNPLVEIALSGLRADGAEVPLGLEMVPATLEEREGLLVTARGPKPVAEPAAAPEMRYVAGATVYSGRQLLVQTIDAALRANAGGALVCVQIENQETLDETLGLGGHDRFAEELLRRMTGGVPVEALVASVSDDTYGVFLPYTGQEELNQQAAEISQAVTRDFVEIDEHTVRPVCRTGGVVLAERFADGMAVLEAAYDVCRHPAPVEAEANTGTGESALLGEKDLAADLLAGMSDGRLSLNFQPIVRLHGEPIELYEVFICLKDQNGNVVPTRDVVSAARQSDLNEELDLWVIEHAIEVLEERIRQGRDTHLFVKLSDQCMENIKIPLTITRTMKARNVPTKNLIIELSEIAASGNLKSSRAFVESLHRVGCLAALDHFGLSLSAFQLLEDVPVAYLKLDASLINRLAEDAQAFTQVAEICQRARVLGKHTIGSYLDNPRSLPKLYEAGVEFAQGYYIQEPGETMDYEFSILVE